MFKAFLLGALIAVALILGGRAVASRAQQVTSKQSQEQKDLEVYQTRLAEATPVEAGQLSEKQRKHSKLFTRYKELRQNSTISQLVSQAKGPYRTAQLVVFPPLTELQTETDTPERYFGELAGKSDAIIRGRVIKKSSQITEDDGFVFTDYEILISEVFKNNVKATIDPGATIVATRPGGTVLLDNVVVKAIDETYTPLPINGDEIVLFLRYIPESGAYQTSSAAGGFELNGSAPRLLSKKQLPPGVSVGDQNSFLRVIRAVSANK